MRMRTLALSATSIFASFLPGSPCAAAPARVDSLPVWVPVIAQLRRHVTIPIVLPSTLPGLREPERPGKPASATAYVEEASASGYTIALGTPGCMGAAACTNATVTGGARMPSGAPVVLAHGIRGIFTPATCGANCGDSTISWRWKNVVYSVGEKAGKLADVLPAADSAIEAAR